MKFEVLENVSAGAGAAGNDDRAGARDAHAWVIDGATDVVATPLVGETSDAEWLAAEIDELLSHGGDPGPLAELPARLAPSLHAAFTRAAHRKPAGREEHPSAAAIVVRLGASNDDERRLEYVSLGDCTLLAGDGARLVHVGIDEDKAGDRWVVERIKAHARVHGKESVAEARRRLWPTFSATRRAMNMPGGYGIFSITAPPAHLVRSGTASIAVGDRVLLATDGLMRLVDVFGRYDRRALFEAACAPAGLAGLVRELRAIEAADAECVRFPRAKASDDATGLLMHIV